MFQQVLPGEERPQQQLPAPVVPKSQEQDVKKKQKFVPLFSKGGQSRSVVQLPGKLNCQGDLCRIDAGFGNKRSKDLFSVDYLQSENN